MDEPFRRALTDRARGEARRTESEHDAVAADACGPARVHHGRPADLGDVDRPARRSRSARPQVCDAGEGSGEGLVVAVDRVPLRNQPVIDLLGADVDLGEVPPILLLSVADGADDHFLAEDALAEGVTSR